MLFLFTLIGFIRQLKENLSNLFFFTELMEKKFHRNCPIELNVTTKFKQNENMRHLRIISFFSILISRYCFVEILLFGTVTNCISSLPSSTFILAVGRVDAAHLDTYYILLFFFMCFVFDLVFADLRAVVITFSVFSTLAAIICICIHYSCCMIDSVFSYLHKH